jgi:hypothetical protein
MGRMKKGVKIPFCCPGNLWPVWGGQTRLSRVYDWYWAMDVPLFACPPTR